MGSASACDDVRFALGSASISKGAGQNALDYGKAQAYKAAMVYAQAAWRQTRLTVPCDADLRVARSYELVEYANMYRAYFALDKGDSAVPGTT